jgi:hypothetical protein
MPDHESIQRCGAIQVKRLSGNRDVRRQNLAKAWIPLPKTVVPHFLMLSESTVDYVIAKRFSKKQSMQWTR